MIVVEHVSLGKQRVAVVHSITIVAMASFTKLMQLDYVVTVLTGFILLSSSVNDRPGRLVCV